MKKNPYPTVEILLGVYIKENISDGLSFLNLQLDSLLSQKYENFRILVRDDGSDKRVLECLSSYHKKHPTKITLINDNKGNLGYTHNYGYLLELCKADYFFLCDQDDIWNHNKLSVCIDTLQNLQLEKNIPLLLCHDAKMIDANGCLLAESYAKHNSQNIDTLGLNDAICDTLSGGYAICGNRALINQSIPIFSEASAHDFHLCVVAKALGKLIYLDKPLVLYRVHSGGVSDSLLRGYRFSLRYLKAIPNKLILLNSNTLKYKRHIHSRYAYAKVALERFKKSQLLSEKNEFVLKNFITLPKHSFITRWFFIKKFNFWRSSQGSLTAKIIAYLG